MTDRRVGTCMIAVGVVLIGFALTFGNYFLLLEISSGAVVVLVGFVLRSGGGDEPAQPDAPDGMRPRVEVVTRSDTANMPDGGAELGQAFAVRQDGGRLRIVEAGEIEATLAPVLQRWQSHLLRRHDYPQEVELELRSSELSQQLRRDVTEIERYLSTLVFRRQSSQEHFYGLLAGLDALLHIAGEPGFRKTLLYDRRVHPSEVWTRPNETPDNS